MGQPSFQASNAIIYFTYGAFLCVKPHILPHNRQNVLTVGAFETQSLGPLCCLALEESVEESILGDESYTAGLDTTHINFLPLALTNRA